jgi:DNA-binding response OmpR family regulator
MRLLLVEDDAKLARAVGRGLRHEGTPSTWSATATRR